MPDLHELCHPRTMGVQQVRQNYVPDLHTGVDPNQEKLSRLQSRVRLRKRAKSVHQKQLEKPKVQVQALSA
jgi:hypothetical protein